LWERPLVHIRLQRFVVGLAAVCAVISPLGAFAAAPQGDAANGKVVYEECSGCHALNENKIGPKHCGLIGRPAGSVADFPNYSHAMTTSGLTWDEKTLNEFLENPLSYLSETGMGFVGLHDEKSRLDVIAYLKKAGADPSLCPK
jgi:cytochrome c